MKYERIVSSGYEPPNPQARCSCGLDDSEDGFRYSVACPKHDGVAYDIVEDEDGPPEGETQL